MTPELRSKLNHIVTLEGWCEVSKAEFLADVVWQTNAQTVVELGVFGGRSLVSMAMACQAKGSGTVWGIDPWSNAAATEGTNHEANDAWWRNCDLEGVYRRFMEAVLRFNLTRECRWLRMKSQQAKFMFGFESIDVLHQDSNHSEEVSCQEFTDWLALVKKGGIWVIDDTDWATNKKAYESIKAISSETLYDDGHWAAFRKA